MMVIWNSELLSYSYVVADLTDCRATLKETAKPENLFSILQTEVLFIEHQEWAYAPANCESG